MHIPFKNSSIYLCIILLIFSSVPLPVSAAENKDPLLTKIQKDSFTYFLDYTPKKTGLTKDSSRPGSPCSIAAVGFYVAALVVAAENKWITKVEAFSRIGNVLKTLKIKAKKTNGFYYHFLDPQTGRRTWGSEASSIDTAILMAGLLLAGEYFKGSHVERKVQRLYEKVNWQWMLGKNHLLCHGYKPERGFLPYYWDEYSEHIILQALAIGSPTHPIPPDTWDTWNRFEEEVDGKRIVYCYTGSLFAYQFSHAFIDFRKLYDRDINYFTNSTYATQANKRFCAENAAAYKTYKDNFWGLTACIGPGGYKAYGAYPANVIIHDGTIAPYGAVASLPFTPEISAEAYARMYEYKGLKIYGPYGFKDAFNVDKKWVANEYLGIDQGITVLMIENFKSEFIWKLFMQLKPIKRWIELCNLTTQ